jgi:hypothetical protein
MGDSSRKGSIVGEVRVDMDRIEVAGNLGVRLVGERSVESRESIILGESISVIGERGGQALRSAMALQVGEDRVAQAVLLRKLDSADLDEDLELIADENVTIDVELAEGRLVLEHDARSNTEDERGARGESVRVVLPVMPLLRLQDADGRNSVEGDKVIRLLCDLESVLVVVEAATVEEGGDDFNDTLALAVDVSADLDNLALVRIGDGDDLSFSLANVADLERLGAINHAEAVGEMHESEEVAVDSRREDGLHDSLSKVISTETTAEKKVYIPSSQ